MSVLTKPLLKRLWPEAPKATIDAVAAIAAEVLREYQITTPLRVAHFMAQCSHECSGGTIKRENMNYRAEQLVKVFGPKRHSAKVTEAEAAMLARKPREIAERVYGLGNPTKAKELGNSRPGDGWAFRGGGMLQLTGGYNYRWAGNAAGVDLYGHPDLIEDPKISFRVSAAEFVKLGCLRHADNDDLVAVASCVNLGRVVRNPARINGYPDRAAWLRKWKVALPDLPDAEPADDEPQVVPRGAEPPEPDKSLLESKIVKGAIGAATASTPPIAGQVIKATVEDAPDAAPTIVEKVTEVVDKATGAIETSRTVIDAVPSPPKGWLASIASVLTDPIVASIFGVVALGAIAYVIFDRRRKLREEGV